MSVNLGVRLKYSELFDDEPLELVEYFKGFSKEVILKAITFFVNITNPKSNIRNATDLFKAWFSAENATLKKQLLRKISKNDHIANIISSLQLVEFVFQHPLIANKQYRMRY